MKRIIIFSLLLMVLTWTASAAPIPTIGYAVGSRGYSLEDASHREYAAVDLIWRPAGGPAVLRLGAAVPVGDGWFTKTRFSGGADLRLAVIRNHPFHTLVSLESQWAPALSAQIVRGIGSDDPLLLQAAIQPFRFEVGGGYISLLSPGIYADVGASWGDQPAGWGIALFDFGFFLK